MNFNQIIAKHNKQANVLDKQLISDFLKGKTFKRYLDTGCDQGEFTAKLGKQIKAKEIHGVEILEQTAKQAEEKDIIISRKDLNQKLNYKKNYFDLITSIQNIEHLYFTDDYLEEMFRILRPGGTFIITTTNLAAIHYRAMLFFGMQPMCLHPSEYKVFPLKGKNPRYGHKSVFTHHALKEVVEHHGFQVIKDYTHSIYFLNPKISDFVCRLLPNFGTFSCFILKKPK